MPAKTAVPSVSDTKPQLNRLRQLRLNPVVRCLCFVYSRHSCHRPFPYLVGRRTGRPDGPKLFSGVVALDSGFGRYGTQFQRVLGAMAAQAAIIAVTHWHIEGIGGLLLAAVLATPVATVRLFGGTAI